MGHAYYIKLDNDDPGFDIHVNGKAVAREVEAISKVTRKLGRPDINDLASFAGLAADFDVDPDIEGAKQKWFDPDAGLDWLRAVAGHIATHPASVKYASKIATELEEYRSVLEQAKAINAKWHFAIDF